MRILRFTFLFVLNIAVILACEYAQGMQPAPLTNQALRQSPMRAQTQRSAQHPMKLDVRLVTQQSPRVGMDIVAEVWLVNANNEPATLDSQCQVEVEVTGPSGASQKQMVTIPAGQSSAQFTFKAKEAGPLSLRARDVSRTLLPGGNSVLVSPGGSVLLLPTRRQPHLQIVSRNAAATAGILDQGGPPAGADQNSSGALLLQNASGKDEFLADGKDFARIKVFFMDADGGAAPSNIKVWLTWSHGKMDPQPLVIRRGEREAEAQWVSMSPVDATLSLVASAPPYPITYPIKGSQELQVSFGPPIYGIDFSPPNPQNPLKISLIDCPRVTAQFFDDQQHTVQTGKPRTITFTSSSPTLHVDPPAFEVPSNQSGASVFLLPTWRGRSELYIHTDGYGYKKLVVEVAIWLVVLLCLVGGAVGGIAAKDKLKGSIAWRVFVGVVGSIVLVWLCVFAVLPNTHSVVAHNLVSVFVVGIIGGYLGTQALDIAGKQLGYLGK